jgi:hypothetical protein
MSDLIKTVVPGVPPIPPTGGTPGVPGAPGVGTKPGVPASPGSPGVPGSPGSPGSPAYCLDVVSYRPGSPAVGVGVPSGTDGDGAPIGTMVGHDPYPAGGGSGPGSITIPGPPVRVVTHECFPAVATVRATPPIAPVPGTPAIPARAPVGSGMGFPGQAGTAGTPGSPPNYEPGWNAGAQSVAALVDNGAYRFTMRKGVVGVYTGLSDTPNPVDQNAINFGFLFGEGVFYVAERIGTQIVAVDGPHSYADNDAFAVLRSGAVVTYTGPSSYSYTSTRAANADLYFAQATLYFGGDSVDDAHFDYSPSLFGSTGSITQTLQPLIINAQDVDGLFGALTPLTANDDGIDATLPNLEFGGTFVADPDVGGIEGYLWPPLAAFAIGLGADNGNAGMHGLLPSTSGFAQQTANGIFSGHLANLGVESSDAVVFITGTLNQLAPGTANGAAQGFLGQLSGYQLFAQGHTDTGSIGYGFYGTLLGDYSLTGYGGGYAKLTGPRPQLTGSGTVTALWEIALTGPSPRLMASATGVALGRAYLQTGGRYKLLAYAGGQATLELVGAYTLNASALSGSVGEAYLRTRPHHLSLVAHAEVFPVSGVSGTLGNLQPKNSGVAILTGPRFTLVATGSETLAVTYEGYSHTLLEGGGVAVTHLTNYPFDHLLRFGTRYFGVRADGLYELTGNNFNGDPIIAVVQTGESDMGEPSLKRTRHLNIAGRISRDLGVTVYARENEVEEFSYDPVEGGARNTRVTLGRGLEARYLSFGITNTDGQDFEIHELAPEVDVLRRTA